VIYVPSARMADGRQWTTANLAIALDDSYCYADDAQHCLRYGRLYTWPAARRACRRLGRGWKLPTDQDWQLLARSYGGMSAESADTGRTAYRELSAGGGSGFNAQFGGGGKGGMVPMPASRLTASTGRLLRTGSRPPFSTTSRRGA